MNVIDLRYIMSVNKAKKMGQAPSHDKAGNNVPRSQKKRPSAAMDSEESESEDVQPITDPSAKRAKAEQPQWGRIVPVRTDTTEEWQEQLETRLSALFGDQLHIPINIRQSHEWVTEIEGWERISWLEIEKLISNCPTTDGWVIAKVAVLSTPSVRLQLCMVKRDAESGGFPWCDYRTDVLGLQVTKCTFRAVRSAIPKLANELGEGDGVMLGNICAALGKLHKEPTLKLIKLRHKTTSIIAHFAGWAEWQLPQWRALALAFPVHLINTWIEGKDVYCVEFYRDKQQRKTQLTQDCTLTGAHCTETSSSAAPGSESGTGSAAMQSLTGSALVASRMDSAS